jgi:TIR domain-containing protein
VPVGQAPKIELTKSRAHGEIFITGSAVPRYVQDPHSARGHWRQIRWSEPTTNHGPTRAGSQRHIENFRLVSLSDDSSDDARKITEVVDRLCETLRQDGWNILRYREELRSGELISGFMKRIGLADHVIVVLTDKYLRSPYCMTELYAIYRRSLGEKEEFLRRIIALVLADARFSAWRDLANYAKHWKTEFEEVKNELPNLGPADFRLYKEMQKWYLDVGEILAYVSDIVVPHGFDEIVKDDFASLRQIWSSIAETAQYGGVGLLSLA